MVFPPRPLYGRWCEGGEGGGDWREGGWLVVVLVGGSAAVRSREEIHRQSEIWDRDRPNLNERLNTYTTGRPAFSFN